MPLKIEGKKSDLFIRDNQIQINSVLNGSIRTRNRFKKRFDLDNKTIEVYLTCFKRKIARTMRAQGPGTRETIESEPIWQDYAKSKIFSENGHIHIDFQLIIPATVLATNPDKRTGIFWKLSVKWEGFKESFELEVGPNMGTKEIELHQYSSKVFQNIANDQKIQLDRWGASFPIGRFLSRSLFPLLIGLGIFSIAIAFKQFMEIVMFSFEGLFVSLFMFVGTIFIIRSLYGLFFKSKVFVNAGKLHLKTSSIFGTKHRAWSPDQIKSIYIKGDGYVNDKLYYKILLQDIEGNRETIGEGIRGYTFAKSLTTHLTKMEGMKRF